MVQGEGALAGMPTHFIRFGLCDYRCEWCDSMYAVEPERVKENAERLTVDALMTRVEELTPGPQWVTLSGGNPALHDLTQLVAELQLGGYKVCVETQGSIWRDWLGSVECLTVSPKPPSSGMATLRHERQLSAFMVQALLYGKNVEGALKIVVFDDEDFEWAVAQFKANPEWDGYLSVGTDPVARWGSEVVSAVSIRQVRNDVGERYAWLCNMVAGSPELAHVRVLPQLHVVAFGHARGV